MKRKDKDKDKDKVLIIGTIPSTSGVGGVTVHVSRLCEALKENEVIFELCDYKVLGLTAQIGMIKQSTIVHLHVSNPFLRLLYVSICRLLSKKVILTFHGNLGRFGALKNLIDLYALRMCNVPIMINNDSYIKAKSYNSRSVLIPAYIPEKSKPELPDEVMDVIQKYKSEGKLIVSTNASYMQFSDIGDEIYGIHFLVQFFKDRDEYILMVSDPSGQYSEYYRDENLKNVCIFKQKHSYASLLSYSDIMIRATATDGDSLSVREALDQGVRVIATDCVDRPDGVLLYKYNDEESLMKSLNINECQKRLHNSQKDVVNSIVSLYQGLLIR